MSSGPREERAQGRGGTGSTGGPKAAEPAAGDWYVDETYARDPHADDAFGSAASNLRNRAVSARP